MARNAIINNFLGAMRPSELTKKILSIVVIVLTVTLFVGYFLRHPELIQVLTSIKPGTILLLILGYSTTILINAFVLLYSLKLIGKSSNVFDNLMLTGYSSIVNFFGPLQSGPGFRALYLKKKHHVRIRDFFVTTLIFYGFFASINITILLVALIARNQQYAMAGLLISVLTVSILTVIYHKKKSYILLTLQRIKIAKPSFWYIGIGALALTIATAGIYHIELTHIDSSISFKQSIVYTAAADLALFVALTPGAIGFRESFLILSQHLHQIDTSTIVGASVIDRAFYVLFLFVLFILLLLINARKKLQIFSVKRN